MYEECFQLQITADCVKRTTRGRSYKTEGNNFFHNQVNTLENQRSQTKTINSTCNMSRSGTKTTIRETKLTDQLLPYWARCFKRNVISIYEECFQLQITADCVKRTTRGRSYKTEGNNFFHNQVNVLENQRSQIKTIYPTCKMCRSGTKTTSGKTKLTEQLFQYWARRFKRNIISIKDHLQLQIMADCVKRTIRGRSYKREKQFFHNQVNILENQRPQI